jgi:membrane protease YdiL (CAAX protease family)
MSASYLSKSAVAATHDAKAPQRRRWWLIAALPAWVFASFIFAQAFVVMVIALLREVGVDFVGVNTSVLETVGAALIYLLCFGIIVSLPWVIKRYRTGRTDLGLTRLPSWADIGMAPAGFVIYLIASGLVIYAVAQSVPGFNASERQEIGFQDLSRQYEYILAFLTLVIIAPIAEEAIFRGFLYGKLRKVAPLWVAVLVTSLLFGLLHMKWDGGLIAGINVGIDVFILSIVMCSLREVTGSIWAGILLHMMKNGLAYYLLFINTTLLTTMGG